jgi:hypothetical protein
MWSFLHRGDLQFQMYVGDLSLPEMSISILFIRKRESKERSLEFEALGLKFKEKSLKFKVQCLEFQVPGSEFIVLNSVFEIQSIISFLLSSKH